MATVAGLNKKFLEDCDGVQPQAPAAANPAQPPPVPVAGFLDKVPAHKVQLSAFLKAQEDQLKPLVASDEGRSAAIAHLDKQVPDSAQLALIKTNFAARHNELMNHMRQFHERQYEAFESKLETLNLPPNDQRFLLEGLQKAQQSRIDSLEKRGKNDQERLTTFVIDRDMAFSAASILGNLKPGKDPSDAKQEKENPAGALVERWRAPLWPLMKTGLMKLPGGIGEKFAETVGEDPELFDQPGEVEAKLAKNFSMKNFARQRKEGKFNAKDETMRMDNVGDPSLDNDWATIDSNYFDLEKTHHYTDLGAAGVFRRKGTLEPLQKMIGSAGEFSVTVGYIPRDKQRGIPEAKNGLITQCAGNVTDAQKLVRVGVLAHEAMARGWKSVNLAHMPQRWRDEAYLALRRAGFRHDQIKVSGELFTSPELQDKGNEQRARIEKQFKKNVPIKDIQKLSLQIQNPDRSLEPEEFFSLAAPEQKKLFEHPATSAAQRAELVLDPAFDMNVLQGYDLGAGDPQLNTTEQAALIDALFQKDPKRAAEAFSAILQQAQQGRDVLGALSTKVAAGILPQLTQANIQALQLGNLPIEKKASWLFESGLLPDHKVLLFGANPADQKSIIQVCVASNDAAKDSQVALLLVGLAKDPNNGAQNAINALNLIKREFSHARYKAISSAFINDPQLTASERDNILSRTRTKALLNSMAAQNILLALFNNPGLPPTPLTDVWLKAQGVAAEKCQDVIAVRQNLTFYASLRVTAANFISQNQNRLANFINGQNAPTYLEVAVQLINDLPDQEKQEVLGVRPHANIMPQIPQASAIAILKASPDRVMDAVVDRIDIAVNQVPNSAADLLCQLNEPERVARALLKLNVPLFRHLTNLLVAPHLVGAFDIAEKIGVVKLGHLLATAQQADRDDLVKRLVDSVNAKLQSNPNPNSTDEIKFLVQIIESAYTQSQANARVVFRFDENQLILLLPYIHSPGLIEGMLNYDPQGNVRNNAQIIQVIEGIPAEQRAKVFKEVPLAEKINVFNQLNPVNQALVFDRLPADRQTQVIAALAAVNINQNADTIVTYLSNAKLPKDQRAALWISLDANKQGQILQHLTKPTAAFFVMVFEAAGDKTATFNQMVGFMLAQQNPAQTNCFTKLAHALAVSGTAAELRTLFGATLTAIAGANNNQYAPSVEALRVQMLDQLVQKGRLVEARSLYNALDANTKQTLRAAVVQHANGSVFEKELKSAVGATPPAPPPAPVGQQQP